MVKSCVIILFFGSRKIKKNLTFGFRKRFNQKNITELKTFIKTFIIEIFIDGQPS